jgi:hypothetical protein
MLNDLFGTLEKHPVAAFLVACFFIVCLCIVCTKDENYND